VFFPEHDDVGETKHHLETRNTLYQSVRIEFSDRATIGSEQFLYWDPTDPTRCCAPDLMLRFGQADEAFRVWKVWERGAPQLAVEILSESDATDRPWERKFERYRQSGVSELVSFDADDDEQPMRIWDRVEGDLVERELDGPDALECATLGLHWTIVHDATYGRMLRLARDPAGKVLLPSPEELFRDAERGRADAERGRADAEARIRELEAKLRGEV
jgi:hypothetical protein